MKKHDMYVCPYCGKQCKSIGMAHHMRLVHKKNWQEEKRHMTPIVWWNRNILGNKIRNEE